jgi:hypothetical protein
MARLRSKEADFFFVDDEPWFERDFEIRCSDGIVLAPRIVMEGISGDVVLEAMRIDPSKLVVPFDSETMRALNDFFEYLDEDSFPFKYVYPFIDDDRPGIPKDPEIAVRAAKALVFLGAKDAFEHFLTGFPSSIATLGARGSRIVAENADDVFFKSSCDSFLRDLFEAAFDAHPFWPSFKAIIDGSRIDSRIAIAAIEGIGVRLPKSWVVIAICDRMKTLGERLTTEDVDVMLEEICVDIHPSETRGICRAISERAVSDSPYATETAVVSALSKAALSYDRGCISYTAFFDSVEYPGCRGGVVSTHHSEHFRIDDHYDIPEDASEVSIGERSGTVSKLLDGNIAATIKLPPLNEKKGLLYVAVRMSVALPNGTPASAEEWTLVSLTGRTVSVRSGLVEKSAADDGAQSVAAALKSHPNSSLLIDFFYEISGVPFAISLMHESARADL